MLATELCILIISINSAAIFPGEIENQVTQTRSINVSCVGDSITEWSGYPARLQKMLGSDYEVGNFGVAGAAVSTSWYNSYVNQWEFYESKEFAPSIVVIMLGTNDAHTLQYASNFSYDYKKLVFEYLTLPSNPRVFLVKPPPIYDNELELSATNLDCYVIPGIDQVAHELGLPTVDLNSALRNRPEFFEDGVHPNSEGAQAIAKQIIEAVNFEN